MLSLRQDWGLLKEHQHPEVETFDTGKIVRVLSGLGFSWSHLASSDKPSSSPISKENDCPSLKKTGIFACFNFWSKLHLESTWEEACGRADGHAKRERCIIMMPVTRVQEFMIFCNNSPYNILLLSVACTGPELIRVKSGENYTYTGHLYAVCVQQPRLLWEPAWLYRAGMSTVGSACKPTTSSIQL